MIRILLGTLALLAVVGCGGISNQEVGNEVVRVDPCANKGVGEVCLEWEAPADARVRGYKVYVGPASGLYTASWDVGNVTKTKVRNLQAGQLYYFAVTAHDGASLESVYSNEVNKTMPLVDVPRTEAMLGEKAVWIE